MASRRGGSDIQQEAPVHWRSAPDAPGSGPSDAVPQNERTLGMATHLAALSGLVVPLGTFLGPLIVWLVKKDESRFVDDQGKQALNFQATLLIATLVIGAFLFLSIILAMLLIGIPLLVLGAMALGVVMVVSYVFAIIGAVKANEGVWYRYPFAIRFFK